MLKSKIVATASDNCAGSGGSSGHRLNYFAEIEAGNITLPVDGEEVTGPSKTAENLAGTPCSRELDPKSESEPEQEPEPTEEVEVAVGTEIDDQVAI